MDAAEPRVWEAGLQKKDGAAGGEGERRRWGWRVRETETDRQLEK